MKAPLIIGFAFLCVLACIYYFVVCYPSSDFVTAKVVELSEIPQPRNNNISEDNYNHVITFLTTDASNNGCIAAFPLARQQYNMHFIQGLSTTCLYDLGLKSGTKFVALPTSGDLVTIAHYPHSSPQDNLLSYAIPEWLWAKSNYYKTDYEADYHYSEKHNCAVYVQAYFFLCNHDSEYGNVIVMWRPK